ncbi:MAG: alpha/beta hydrolase [Theionarchaea archaeon]|nr:alpha/beta hydrolase [Theionarchaea archaeon]
MKNINFDTLYKNVPHEQRERLMKFRSTHPYKSLTVDDITWEYISCGRGESTLVLLPGGSFRLGETWFQLITAFEDEYKIISPTYPAVPTMAERVNGILSILKSEKIDKIHMLGWSLGGWIAQCFVRQHPATVKTLILSNTSGPDSMSEKHLRIAPFLISTYPMRLFQYGLKMRLVTLLNVSDSEREFWKAFFEEISLRTTKDDIINERKAMLDYMSTYQFSKDDLVNWPGKILIVESDNDSAFDKSAREELKTLYPQAQIHTFRNAGHSPVYDNPTEYISVVRNFLSGQ